MTTPRSPSFSRRHCWRHIKFLVTIVMPILRRVFVAGGSFAVFCLACYMKYKFLATVVDARSLSSIRQVFYGHAVLGQGCCCARRGSTTGALVLTVEPQLQFIVGRRRPRHGDVPVAVHMVIDALVVQLHRVPQVMVQTVQKTVWNLRRCSAW